MVHQPLRGRWPPMSTSNHAFLPLISCFHVVNKTMGKVNKIVETNGVNSKMIAKHAAWSHWLNKRRPIAWPTLRCIRYGLLHSRGREFFSAFWGYGKCIWISEKSCWHCCMLYNIDDIASIDTNSAQGMPCFSAHQSNNQSVISK